MIKDEDDKGTYSRFTNNDLNPVTGFVLMTGLFKDAICYTIVVVFEAFPYWIVVKLVPVFSGEPRGSCILTLNRFAYYEQGRDVSRLKARIFGYTHQ